MDIFLPDHLKSRLLSELDAKPMVRAATVSELTESMDPGDLMMALLPLAARYARVPISGFQVGAVAQGASGALYFGANMEFPGHALSFSVHGEQSAVTHAWLSGETGLRAIAVNAAPCGYCRQFLYEISPEIQVRLGGSSGHSSHPLTHYLPNAFGPRDLDISGRLMHAQDQRLTIDRSDPLAQAALAAANASYAPYTQNFSGVALQTMGGSIHTGRYAENAAYNPSMSPLESALAILNLSEPVGMDFGITAAVLVEKPGSLISQRSATEAVLSTVAPQVILQYVETQ